MITIPISYDPTDPDHKLRSTVSTLFGWYIDDLRRDDFLDRVDDWWSQELGKPGFTPRQALATVHDLFADSPFALVWRDRYGISSAQWVRAQSALVSALDGWEMVEDRRAALNSYVASLSPEDRAKWFAVRGMTVAAPVAPEGDSR